MSEKEPLCPFSRKRCIRERCATWDPHNFGRCSFPALGEAIRKLSTGLTVARKEVRPFSLERIAPEVLAALRAKFDEKLVKDVKKEGP